MIPTSLVTLIRSPPQTAAASLCASVRLCPTMSVFPELTWWTLENCNFIVLCNHNSASVWIYARGSPWGQSVTRGECVLRNLPDRHPGNCVEGRPRNAGIPGGFIFVGKGDKSRGGEGRGKLHVFWEGAAVRNKSKKQTKSQTLDTVSLTHHTCPCHTRFDLWPSIPSIYVIVSTLSEEKTLSVESLSSYVCCVYLCDRFGWDFADEKSPSSVSFGWEGERERCSSRRTAGISV